MTELRRKSPVATNWAVVRRERAERTKTEGYVYFIACGPYIKIGYSFDHPRRRLDEMLTGNPYPCELIGITAGGWKRERELHRRFSRLRHAREWFCAAPELLAFIAEACDGWLALDAAIAVRERMSPEERRAREMGLNHIADIYWGRK